MIRNHQYIKETEFEEATFARMYRNGEDCIKLNTDTCTVYANVKGLCSKDPFDSLQLAIYRYEEIERRLKNGSS